MGLNIDRRIRVSGIIAHANLLSVPSVSLSAPAPSHNARSYIMQRGGRRQTSHGVTEYLFIYLRLYTVNEIQL